MRKFLGYLNIHGRKGLVYVLMLILLQLSYSCPNSIDGQQSRDPFGNQQILLNALPFAIFGNGCSFSQIEALFNELLTIDGTTIQAQVFSDDLPFELRGCITSSDQVVINGRAEIEYLGGPLIGLGVVGTVNVSVTSILPNGEQQSNFVPVSILGVDIVEIVPIDSITANPIPMMGEDPLPPVFATVEVTTFGIVPGTFVDFQLTDLSCGFLSGATSVLGTIEDGVAIVQYNAIDGESCTQTVIVNIILTDPRSKSLACDPVPLGLRTIQASITFEQIVAPVPTPTPTPGPSPTPTPTPIAPPSIDVTAFKDTIEPDGTTIVTATVNTGAATPVCCDIIPIQSDPMSLLGFPPALPPDCGLTNINGDFNTVLTGGNVVTLQTIQIRCCIDDSGAPNGVCDPDDVQNDTIVDIDPAGVPPPIELVASPSMIPPAATSTLTVSTMPPVDPGTELCVQFAINTSPNSTIFEVTPPGDIMPKCKMATTGGQAVFGLQANGGVAMTTAVTIQGCINLNGAMDDDCDATDPSDFVSVAVTPPSPAMPIIITSTDLNPMAGDSPGIDAFTNQPIGTDVCVQFIMNSTPASDLDPGNMAVAACGMTDASGNVIGLFALDVNAGASGDQITIVGCIDDDTSGTCDVGEPLSNVLTFNVQ